MHNIKYLFLLFILVLTSCEDSSRKKSASNGIQLILQDSIVVDYVGALYLRDYHESLDRYLSFDQHNGMVVEFDSIGNITYQFNPTIEGPDGIEGELVALSYFQDSLFLVQSMMGYYAFNRNSQKVNYYKPNITSSLYSNMKYNIESNDAAIFSMRTNGTDIRMTEKAYYKEAKQLTVVKTKPDTSHFLAINFEENSIYRNPTHFYYYSYPAFDYNPSDSLIYIVYSMNKNIYAYDPSDEFELKKTIQTSPSFFNEPIKTPFGKQPHTIKSLAYSSAYHNILSNGKYTILEYYTALPEEIDLPGSIAELNELYLMYNQYYYELFYEGEKLGEVELPEGKFGMHILKEDGTIFFQLDKNKYERDYEVFYEYKILY